MYTKLPSLAVQRSTRANITSPQEMDGHAPRVRELIGTWRWIWRTGHGHIRAADGFGGIAFRMADHASTFTHEAIYARMRYDPQLNQSETRWFSREVTRIPGAMEIMFEFDNGRRVPVRLRFTVQPGQRSSDFTAEYAHRHLLCVKYIDPEEGEVELFALAMLERNRVDGPRGFPAEEEASDDYGYERAPLGLLGEFGLGFRESDDQNWQQWLGWKGVQRGWYQELRGWTFW